MPSQLKKIVSYADGSGSQDFFPNLGQLKFQDVPWSNVTRRVFRAMQFGRRQRATIEELAGLLRQHEDKAPETPLVSIQSRGAKRPLFCVHPAGGNVLCYTNLARHLGQDRPFYGFQSESQNGEHTCDSQIEVMAARYIDLMRSVQAEGPYLVSGWSLGGVVAFEMTRQLEEQGQEVALLALLDSKVPSFNEKLVREDDDSLLLNFVQDLGLTRDQLIPIINQFQDLQPNEQMSLILEQAKNDGILIPDIGLSQIHRLLNVYRNNVRAVRNYVPQRSNGRIIHLRASERPAGIDQRPTIGWDELAVKGVKVYEVPGNHYTMIREPHVRVLADRLKRCIDEIETGVDR